MKGFRTLLVNALVIGAAAILHFLAGMDLTTMLGPTGSLIALAVINMLLRLVTSTPAGTSGS